MFIACAFLISVLLFEFCDICYLCMELVYSIGLAKGVLLILVIWCLLHLYSWLLLCAYHFHGRMSQWQTFMTLWLTIVYSELNYDCLFIIAEHLFFTFLYCWLGSCTMFKWYLGLNFHESPFFDYHESNQVDVRVMCLCTWIFVVCLFFCRSLADLPKEKRL